MPDEANHFRLCGGSLTLARVGTARPASKTSRVMRSVRREGRPSGRVRSPEPATDRQGHHEKLGEQEVESENDRYADEGIDYESGWCPWVVHGNHQQ